MSGNTRFQAPEYVRRISPYRPGRPVDVVQRQLGVERLCQLASNENTYGPSPQAVEALTHAVGQSNYYPDGGGYHLRRDLAQVLGVEPEAVVLGNGSGELVDLLCKAFVTDRERVVMSRYGFVQYRLSAQAINADIVDVPPLAGTFEDDPVAMARVANADPRARIVFLANPNNPTGTFVTRDLLDAYFEEIDPRVLTVVDQAYFEYVDEPTYPDALDDLRAGRNVVVLRTFSKIYGLASLRIGYGVGHPDVLSQVEGVRLPFNTNGLGQVAARAALRDDEYVQRSRERTIQERERLCRELARRGFACTPSLGNFVLVDFGRPARELFEKLLDQGVLIRPAAGYGLPTSQRVTVGTREETDQLLAALDRLEAAQ